MNERWFLGLAKEKKRWVKTQGKKGCGGGGRRGKKRTREGGGKGVNGERSIVLLKP